MHRVFEPFFTTKGPQGTGLGLWLAAGTMRRMGGSIVATPARKRGTRFILTFPLRTAADPARVTAAAAARRPAPSPPRTAPRTARPSGGSPGGASGPPAGGKLRLLLEGAQGGPKRGLDRHPLLDEGALGGEGVADPAAKAHHAAVVDLVQDAAARGAADRRGGPGRVLPGLGAAQVDQRLAPDQPRPLAPDLHRLPASFASSGATSASVTTKSGFTYSSALRGMSGQNASSGSWTTVVPPRCLIATGRRCRRRARR